MDKLQLKVEIRHKSNWHNETVRAARRSKFMCALVLALRKVPIYGPGGGCEPLGGPTNPGYSVSVSDELAAAARDKAAKAKEAKRLVPSSSSTDTGKSSSADLGPASEEKAAESMNQRRPLDSVGDTAWTARDDVTLGSREQSLERQRISDIDNLKQTMLKRESTRGRRKPGESVPPVPSMSNPGMTLTQASPHQQNFGRASDNGNVIHGLDEEAELGIHPTGSSQSQLNNPYAGQGYGSGGYSMFPPVAQQQRVMNPLGSQPVVNTGGQGRSRGASFGGATLGGSSGSGV